MAPPATRKKPSEPQDVSPDVPSGQIKPVLPPNTLDQVLHTNRVQSKSKATRKKAGKTDKNTNSVEPVQSTSTPNEESPKDEVRKPAVPDVPTSKDEPKTAGKPVPRARPKQRVKKMKQDDVRPSASINPFSSHTLSGLRRLARAILRREIFNSADRYGEGSAMHITLAISSAA